MKSLYVFLILFILEGFFFLPAQAAMPCSKMYTQDTYTATSPYPFREKVEKIKKKIKKLKKIKRVESNQAAGILVFIIGCMIALVGLGISIVAITDAILTIGLGVLVLGFVVMCIGDIIGNLGLMRIILNLCDCLSVLL